VSLWFIPLSGDHGRSGYAAWVEIEYELVDSEVTPIGELTLRHYRAETGETGYEILLDGSFLMASHGSHSERIMARLAHSRLSQDRDDLTVLMGGLGAGHTLRAVLDLPGVSRVTVAEIGAKVVEWNRLVFAEVNGRAIFDPRVEVRVADLRAVLTDSPDRYDLLLLDVDNGPGWLAAESNAVLYGPAGLTLCRSALRRGGVAAIWSPGPNPALLRALERVFPAAQAVDTALEARACGEPASTIYLGVSES
jgi:spermidine synthase